MSVDVVVAASGIGQRMGAHIPKQYIKLQNKTILEHTFDALRAFKEINKVIIVINKNDNFFYTLDLSHDDKVITTIGGAQRQDSVLNGLKLASSEYVMVHDAARPFITLDDLDKLYEACSDGCAGAILACEVADTLKFSQEGYCIDKTVSRDNFYRALTPQMFNLELLKSALALAKKNNYVVTDEASAMEQCGHKVKLVLGSSNNFKITKASDLELAKAMVLLRESEK